MKITIAIIIINVIVLVLEFLNPGFFIGTFGLVPADAVSGEFWQFVTYMFLHSVRDPAHIGLNMLIFLLFGPAVEHQLSRKFYIFLYLISGIGSAFLYIALAGLSIVPLIGASGSVFGILAAYAVLFPKSSMYFFFIPIPIPATAAIVILASLEFIFGLFGLQPGVANFGHLGGVITAAAIMIYWKYVRKSKLKRFTGYEFFWE